MKVHLLYHDQDIDLQRPLPWNEAALIEDLALNTLFNAMAKDDKFVFEVAKKVVLNGLHNDLETIRYRQKVLQDCLNHAAVVRELYRVAVETVENEKKLYFSSMLSRYPDWVLRHSVELLEMFVGMLKKLRRIADSHAAEFISEGWTALFATLQTELSDDYFSLVQQHLEQLKFRYGLLLSAKLGEGNKGTNYTLHVVHEPRRRSWEWLRWIVGDWLMQFFRWDWLARFAGQPDMVLEFSIDPRDESGARTLAELRNRGISLVANALAQSADHVRSFFDMLRAELAFYVGCVNLHEQLVHKGEPTCFPVPMPAEDRRLSFRGLYDACLSLNTKERVVGNDADADEQNFIVITGANQGGKSTFLRSVGLAQLMMQPGMFVPAESFCASIYDGLFTHFKREEDRSMTSGKLDEELSRMSGIVDHITSDSMILFNESFAATNEREGSEIARQIVSALLDKRVKIGCVTHLYEFARDFYAQNNGRALFLRADRQTGGVRTFKLVEGGPLQTSFGEDLYKEVFGVGLSTDAD